MMQSNIKTHNQKGTIIRSLSLSAYTRLSLLVDHNAHIFFPAPTLLVLSVLFVGPIIYTIYLSFHHYGLSVINPPLPIGLENYLSLLNSHRFRGALINTFIFSSTAVIVQTILGFLLALIFNREFIGRGIARTLFLFPMMATPIAAMIGWKLILDPNTGVFNLFTPLGMPKFALLANANTSLLTLVIVDTWQWVPFMTLIILAGLASLPHDPYEAAMIDGASPWQMLLFITIPLLRPVLIMAIIFRTIDSLKTFESIFVLTRGGPSLSSETLNLYVYFTSFEYYQLGYSAALMVVYFFIILFFSVILLRFRKSG